MDSKNYIELAPRLYTQDQPVVIEAFKLGTRLMAVAPLSFVMRHRTIKAAGWKEVDHEPGVISEDEWKRLCNLP